MLEDTNQNLGPAIERYLLQMPEEKMGLACMVRDIFIDIPDITESIKWNNWTFSMGKKDIAFIYYYKQLPYINLGFFNAVALTDKDKLFEGTGAKMRHIKIYSESNIPVNQIRLWIEESIQLGK